MHKLSDLMLESVPVFNPAHNIQANVPPENVLAMWGALQENSTVSK